MRFTAIFSIASLMATQVMGAAINASANEARAASIATDSYYACNCPNNCNRDVGSSCRFYSGPSDSSPVSSGTCQSRSGTMTCVV